MCKFRTFAQSTLRHITVDHNCHIKYKLLTSNTKSWQQIQITHIKNKLLTSNTNYSHQIQNPDIKHKLLTSNTNYWHQLQKPEIKIKIKRSAVGERKLCPVFNLVPRAFPIEIGRGGKRPWHRLVTWSVINISWALIYATALKPSIVIGSWNSPQKCKKSLI